METLSALFAVLAIIISGLGLFGLAAFTAERRTKEIGIRQVLGSGNFQILVLLGKDFSLVVALAVLIGLPLSYFATSSWLARYAFHPPLPVSYFIGASMLMLAIAWVAVGVHTLKALGSNPIAHLQNE